VIQAGVICFRERDNELASPLIACINTHPGLTQTERIHEGDELMQEIGLHKEIWSLDADGGLKLLRVITRDAIPCLSFAPMY
jgi:hypothetical protein